MPKKKMKLFVWQNVLTDWTSGIMIAVAPSIEEARQIVFRTDEDIPERDLSQEPQVYDLPEPIAFVVWGGG